VTCGSSGRQAARAYSLIRPPRTGFRSPWSCCLCRYQMVPKWMVLPTPGGDLLRQIQRAVTRFNKQGCYVLLALAGSEAQEQHSHDNSILPTELTRCADLNEGRTWK
jgi:hypothetical protein